MSGRPIPANLPPRCWKVIGVRRFSTDDIGPVPVTVAQGMARVSRGLMKLGDKSVGYVDSDQLFTLLRQAVG